MVYDGSDAIRPALSHGSGERSETPRLRWKDDRPRGNRAGAAETIGNAEVGAGLFRPARVGLPNGWRGGRAQDEGIARRIGDDIGGNDGQEQAGGGTRDQCEAATRPPDPATIHRRRR